MRDLISRSWYCNFGFNGTFSETIITPYKRMSFEGARAIVHHKTNKVRNFLKPLIASIHEAMKPEIRNTQASLRSFHRRILAPKNSGLHFGRKGERFGPLSSEVRRGTNVNSICLLPSGKNSCLAQIFQAINHGNVQQVQNILSNTIVDPNMRTAEGYTALHLLSSVRSAKNVEALAQVLIKGGVDVNARAWVNSDRTALHLALSSQKTSLVRLLLRAGADVKAGLGHSWANGRACYTSLLGMASQQRDLSMVNHFLQAGADVNSAEAVWGELTALQAACVGENPHIISRLIEAGAVVNAPPADGGLSALAAAASQHDESVALKLVQLLVGHDADVNQAPAADSGSTALQAAASVGHVSVIEYLLHAGADINQEVSRRRGRTALQAAAEMEHLSAVQQLLDAGADVNAAPAPIQGLSALQAAVESPRILRVLADHGADVNTIPNGDGQISVLSKAAGLGIKESVVALIDEFGALVDFPQDGERPLEYAVEYHCEEIVQLLLSRGATPTAAALGYAFEDHSESILRLLLAAGGTLNQWSGTQRWQVEYRAMLRRIGWAGLEIRPAEVIEELEEEENSDAYASEKSSNREVPG